MPKKLTYKQKQERLDTRKSRVVFRSDIKPTNLAQVIKLLVADGEETYSEFPNGQKRLQCYSARSRSVEDCYNVAKNYLPGITYEQVFKAMDQLVTKQALLRGFCCTVKRNVHNNACCKSTAEEQYSNILGELNIKRTNDRSRRIGRKSVKQL